MSYLEIKNINKRFKDDIVFDDVSLSVNKGEFFVVFGPSGSGKTVLLRLLSGIMSQDSGQIFMDGVCIDDLDPNERDISVAFQNFALYPHMDAFENIASPLIAQKTSPDEIKKRVQEVAELLKIDHVLSHKPKELSNGQKQRTSLARSLVVRPSVVLLDDPLRNVDAKIRYEMRLELPKVLKEFNTTVIYVTQDYKEAMALGERVGVLANSKFTDVDDPTHVYKKPNNITSAKLFGDPTINVLNASNISSGDLSTITASKITIESNNPNLKNQRDLFLGIRPEDIQISNQAHEGAIKVELRAKTPLNLRTVYLLRFEDGVEVLASASEEESLLIDDQKDFYIRFDNSNLNFFDQSESLIQ